MLALRHVAGALLAALMLGGAVTGCSAQPGPRAAPAHAAARSPTQLGAPRGNRDAALCRGYAAAAASARAPLDAMRTEAVLLPFIDLIELGTHQVAEQANAGASPGVAEAMREVVAAQDELDAQGHKNLRVGADLTTTVVRLNPDRLATALDAADQSCAVR